MTENGTGLHAQFLLQQFSIGMPTFQDFTAEKIKFFLLVLQEVGENIAKSMLFHRKASESIWKFVHKYESKPSRRKMIDTTLQIE